MIYDAYFHNDFDGRASAAVMLAFLRSRGDDIEHFVPVDFNLTKQWLDEKFFAKHRLFKGKRNPAIVLDFPYHPGAAIWFDHHPTTFKKEAWQKKFKRDMFHRLDSSYLSNCHLTYTALKENFGWKPPAHFRELVKWLDVIDGARYASAEQTIAIKEPALEVMAYVDGTEDDLRATAAFVKLLTEEPLGEIAKMPAVRTMAAAARKTNLKALAFYRSHLKVEGDATFVDLIGTDFATLRFAPYYLHPKVLYAVRVTKRGKFYHVGVGANPWMTAAARKKHADVHIGELMRKFGGGGHKNAGACEIATKRKAIAAAKAIIPVLNGD